MRGFSESEFENFLFKATEKINSYIRKAIVRDTGSFSSTTQKIVVSSVVGGGKMVRAILSYIVSKILGIPDSISLRIAYSIELSHAFTLIHDDIIDKPKLRRGRKPIFAEFGEDLALLSGDLLLLLTFIHISFSPELVKFLAQNMSEVVEGQILDVLWAKNNLECQDKEKAILEIQAKKTSHLFKVAFILPLLIYESTNKNSKAKKLKNVLDSLGVNFGIAFQIKDDIMDIDEDRKSHSPNILDALGERRTIELLKLQKSKVDSCINSLQKLVDKNPKAKFFVELLKYFADKILSYEEGIQNFSQSQTT